MLLKIKNLTVGAPQGDEIGVPTKGSHSLVTDVLLFTIIVFTKHFLIVRLSKRNDQTIFTSIIKAMPKKLYISHFIDLLGIIQFCP